MGALNGVLLLVRFRPEGFASFAATPQGFMNSLAPMLAIAAVGALLSGSVPKAALQILMGLVALLTPAVISHFLARAWGREAVWLRYAVAFNWCQTTVNLLMLGATGAMEFGSNGFKLVAVGILAYVLGLYWFLMRQGLGVSPTRAALGVLTTTLASGLLLFGPLIIAVSLR